jgi:hypothetical protein
MVPRINTSFNSRLATGTALGEGRGEAHLPEAT